MILCIKTFSVHCYLIDYWVEWFWFYWVSYLPKTRSVCCVALFCVTSHWYFVIRKMNLQFSTGLFLFPFPQLLLLFFNIWLIVLSNSFFFPILVLPKSMCYADAIVPAISLCCKGHFLSILLCTNVNNIAIRFVTDFSLTENTLK